MKKIFLILTTMILLSGCGTVSNKMENNVVSKQGEIKTKVGEEFLLSTEDGIVNITSNKVNLDNYLKKKVKVEGMFSGSTLYVDKIENN